METSTTFRSFSGAEKTSFAEEEEKVLQFWEEIDAFKTQLKLSEGKPVYTFYDGPPFATGLPHYGHILAGTIKDVVTRYQTQKGHYVERRFGWDCHGVPIEFEIEKIHKITGKEQIEAMGIDKYNGYCRGIVLRYTAEWEKTVKRCGRWIDFRNDYKTMDLDFMESVWWVFKEIYDKGLVYEGYKVMPYSTALTTPLSNFEAKQNMKEDVVDPAVVVSFPVKGDPDNASFLAWTTTPWTLPSNLALCVNPTFKYEKLRVTADATSDGYFYEKGDVFIIGSERKDELFPPPKKKKKKSSWPPYEIIGEMTGADLVGKSYEPLFDYFGYRADGGDNYKPNFVVVADDYVTADAGTCIVHQAPGFGEDDNRVCLRENIISQKVIPCPIDHAGRYTKEVADTATTAGLGLPGVYVKDADKNIAKFLKEKKRLKKQGTLKHAYPLCWRSDTPLLYRTIPSWFIEVTKIKKDLVARNQETYWVPTHVKEKRFHNWLVDARDWCVSRNRYWGTPLPIWRSADGEEIVVVGSVEELEKLSGIEGIKDLHRESIDDIVIPSKEGRGDLKRVPEVFDCWFESGSMPYAQAHYPFKDKEQFQAKFPADFIAEGLDQTRGWFYTLMVLSTALFNKPAFKNLIVNGLVLAEDGKKMSKRLRNFPPPTDIISRYGADALRVYLMDSPVVRAEPLRFSERGVRDVVRILFNPWWNSYKLFIQEACRFETLGGKFVYDPTNLKNLNLTPIDRWILSRLQTLTREFRKEMDAYKLYEVIPHLTTFLDEFSNRYVRFSKGQLKGFEGPESCEVTLAVTFHVLLTTCQLMAPFTPFLVETMYQNLKSALPNPPESIHYYSIPECDESYIDSDLEERFSVLDKLLKLTRQARDQVKEVTSYKYPMSKVVVVSPEKSVTDSIQVDNIVDYVKDDCTIKDIEFSNEMTDWIRLECVPDNRALGRRLGKKAREVKSAMRELDQKSLQTLKDGGKVTVCGEEVDGSTDCVINYNFQGDAKKYSSAQDGNILVVLDKEMTPVLLRAGQAAEVRSLVQQLRKKVDLSSMDKVWVYFEYVNAGKELELVVEENMKDIETSLRCPFCPVSKKPEFACVLGTDQKAVADGEIKVYLVRPCARLSDTGKKRFSSVSVNLDSYLQNKNYSNLKSQNGPYSLVMDGKEITLEAEDLLLEA